MAFLCAALRSAAPTSSRSACRRARPRATHARKLQEANGRLAGLHAAGPPPGLVTQLHIASDMLYHEFEDNFWTPTAMLVSDMEVNELVTYGEGLTNELLRILSPQRVADTEQYAAAVPGVIDVSDAEHIEKAVAEKPHDGFDIQAVDPEHPQGTEPFDLEGDDGDDIKKSADEQVVQFAAERTVEPPNQEAIEASKAVQIEQAVPEKLHDGFLSQAEVQEQFLGTEPFDEAAAHDDAIEVNPGVIQEQFGTTSWKYRAGENWLSFGNQSAEIENASVQLVEGEGDRHYNVKMDSCTPVRLDFVSFCMKPRYQSKFNRFSYKL
ncbi:unnamed protein product [Prorocentrum cordatum]|uniref:Uncharacterized protein n=1 Tax=Prorocentrum cordatum TaxID=2364126 RepID=A0ABN9SRP1_9DINO|nr:unnamed protein product [Polarella glacialis]